jgi:LytS/YehU family sensor histidine kinase
MTIPRPGRTYWICQVAGWLLYAGINVAFFAATWAGNVVVTTVSVLSNCALGAFYTHGYRRLIHRRGWLRLPLLALVPRMVAASLALGALLDATGVLTAKVLLPAPLWSTPTPASLLVYLFNFSVVFFGWQLIYFGVHLFDRSRRLEVERWQLAAAARESELRYLKAQINPHFLFNCLNGLRALIAEDAERAQSMVTRLANLLRYALGTAHDQLIPLKRELDVVQDYLALEGIRFERRLRTRFDIAPESQAALVPPMLVQMLVENGIKHGIGQLAEGGEIAVSARIVADQLELEVRNSADATPCRTDGEGIGLVNGRNRLGVLFGGRAALEVERGVDRFTARVRIPLS